MAKLNLQKEIPTICPYWQALKCALKATTEGIYIPLDNHIAIYCKSSEYKLCSQYSEVNAQQPVADSNKRKRIRRDSKHPITIVHLNDSGNITSRGICKATTIDLSMSGMRLMTEEPMRKNSLIQFSLDNSTSNAAHHGIAISKWCSSARDKEGYFVGFAFHNKETTKDMGNYFNVAIRREKSAS